MLARLKISFSFAVVLILFVAHKSFAELNFSLNGSGASGSRALSIGAGFDREIEDTSVSYNLNTFFGKSITTSTYVTSLGESEINVINYGFSAGLNAFEHYGITIGVNSDSVNQNKVSGLEFTLEPRFRFKDFNIGFAFSEKKLNQISSYLVLNRNYNSDLQLKQTTQKINLNYIFSDVVSINGSHSVFGFDKNLESTYSLLSLQTLATNNGVEFLSQIDGLLDSSSEIGFIYNFYEKFDFDFSISKSIEYYSPKKVSNDVRAGFTYYQNEFLTWGLGASFSKTADDNSVSRSYDGSLNWSL